MNAFSLRHRLAHASATLLVTLCFTAPSTAQPDNGTNALADNIGTGAFAAMKEEVASLPDHVVYRPRDLAALGAQKLGVVAWGNGGCSDDGASSRFHLLELASHGYLVIANGRVYSGPGAATRAALPAGQEPPATRTQSTQLIEAIDWALAENARADSPYFGRIDADQIALSGFSCGGVQALRQAGDPRISTLVLHNTGIFNGAPTVPSPEMDISKDALAAIHTPTIYILGGETDIAYANGMDDFQRITHVPVAVANLPVGHGGTYHLENGGSAAQVAVNWLQWQLRGDADARNYFVGENCVLCTDAEWTLDSKGLE